MTYDLEDLLDASAPPLQEAPGTPEAVKDLVLAARGAARPVRKRRRRRALAIGTTSVLLVAGGTAVAATQGHWTSPWADHPLNAMTFRLPSGGICEERVGDLHLADPAAQSLITDWLSSHPIAEIADINAAIRELRGGGPGEWVRDDGTVTATGYGTEHYDADNEYWNAVSQALYTAVVAKLKAAGFTKYMDWHWSAETHCDGSNKKPQSPWWLK